MSPLQGLMNKLESIPVALPQAIKLSPLWGFHGLLKQLLRLFRLPLSRPRFYGVAVRTTGCLRER
jgi:hypothetical protein